MILEDRVTNLSHQLRDAKLEVSIRQRKDADSKLEGSGLFTKSVAIAENLSRDVDDLQRENERLRKQLKEMGAATLRLERESHSNTHFFVEGASWVARNTEFMLNQVRQRVTELEHRFRDQFDSIKKNSSESPKKNESKRKKKVLRKWADKSHLKLKPSEVKEEHSDSHRGLWRLHDLLFDRIAHELSSLERRVHRVVQDATNSWDDREKQISFLHSLPLDAPSVIDPKSPRGGGEDDDEFSDDDDDDTFATNSEMMGDDDSYSNISVSTYE